MKTARRRRGLTLIETLLALTILGTGLSILVTGAARALTVARVAQHYSNAQFLLASVDLELPVTSPYELYQSPESGDFNPPYDLYRWSRSAEYFGPEDDQLFLIRTRVTWYDRGDDSYEEALTLERDREAPVDAGARDAAESAAASGGPGAGAGTSSTRTPRPGMRVRSVQSQPRSNDPTSGSRARAPGREGAARFQRGDPAGSAREAPSGMSRPGGPDGATPRSGSRATGASGSRWRRSNPGGGPP